VPSINPNIGQNVEYNHTPDVCPQCHHALNPTVLNGTVTGEISKAGTRLEIAYKCTHRSCCSMFIGQYVRKQVHQGSGQRVGPFILDKSVPLKYTAPEIFAEVEEISPSFKKIYEQASAAESYGLDEISGVGYRKALEFLVKDYCIHKSPDSEDAIKSAFLGVVIKDYVDDANLQACAQRAAWLGNDETHYVRKWNNKDINDLKVLINLSCVWVRSNILTEQYLQEME
jgi:hypothetical protein